MGSVLVDADDLVADTARINAGGGIIGCGALDDRVVGAIAGNRNTVIDVQIAERGVRIIAYAG